VWPVDVLHYVFLALLLATSLFAYPSLQWAPWWIAFDLAAAASLLWIEVRSARLSARRAALRRLWHGVPVVTGVFTQTGMLILAVRHVDYAAALERLDRALFLGANPIEVLERVASPWLTEVLQWAYTAYLLLPIGLVALLAWKGDAATIRRALFSLLGVMYLSYLGYFLVPASGPNIHNNLARPAVCPISSLGLYRFADELPGVWLSEALRRWMFEVELTKMDCFPSGHVAVAVVCWIVARRLHRPLGALFGVVAAGVVLSTVYLRYHYVVDVVAGLLLAWFALTAWLRLHDRMMGEAGASVARYAEG
jgi:membrane-associated phospholipid phosphatase